MPMCRSPPFLAENLTDKKEIRAGGDSVFIVQISRS